MIQLEHVTLKIAAEGLTKSLSYLGAVLPEPLTEEGQDKIRVLSQVFHRTVIQVFLDQSTFFKKPVSDVLRP